MFKSINGGKLPERATKYSAGFDVFSNEDIMIIGAGQTAMIGLGIAIDEQSEIYQELYKSDLLNSYYVELHPRSSTFLKGLICNIGVIDMDFVSLEIKLIVHNSTQELFVVNKGDKIGQLIIKRHEGLLLPLEYTKNNIRVGGTGSTGK